MKRRNRGGSWMVKGMMFAAAALTIAMIARELPSIRRYLRVERM